VTGQFSAVDMLLTGRENLVLMAGLHHLGRAAGRLRAAELLERFDLGDAADRPAATYSGGMRRRLDLAMTLVGSPRLIFLDEPTAGLDPRSRHAMWEMIRDLVAGGVTVFLTTQYLEEADRLADRVALLDRGRLVAEGTPEELKRLVPGGHIELRFADLGGLDSAARALGEPARDEGALILTVPSDGGVSSLQALLRRLDAESVAVAGPERPHARPRRRLPGPHGRRDRAGGSPMSTVTLAMLDCATMLRRNLRRTLRYPAGPASTVGVPLVVLLLFVFVFGDTLGAGLPGVSGGRAEYLDYVTPGIVLLAVAGAAQGTAIAVAMDMKEGIIARFRTMAIARVSVLTGHVVGSLLQTLIAMVLVFGVALALGFSPTAGPLDWVLAFALLTAVTLALIWLAVALGMVSKSVESASNLPMPLILLPFLGSGFVPTETMPGAMRWFAEHQPFTPIMETLRGLLMGTPIGSSGAAAVAWCAVIGLAGHAWAKHLFNRDPTP
jgi:ABC-2 type transport system permease protein